MRYVSFVFAVVTALSIVSEARLASAQVQLRWSATPGKVYRYSSIQTSKIAIGEQQAATIEQRLEFSLQALPAGSEGSIEWEMAFGRLQMKITNPVGEFSFDTANPDQSDLPPHLEQIKEMFNALVNAKLRFVTDPRGVVKEISLPDFVEAAGDRNPFWSREVMEQLIQSVLIRFPEEPVREGDKWTNKSSVKFPFGSIERIDECTYAGLETLDGEPVHKITVSATASFKPDQKAPFQVEITDSKIEGVIYLSKDMSHIVQNSLTMEITQSLKLPNQTLEQTIRAEYKAELVP